MINGTSLRWFVAKNYLTKRVVLVLFLMFIFDILYIESKSKLSGTDTLTMLFYGCSGGHFVLIDLLFFLIFNFIPLYFSAITLDSKNINAGNTVMIRFKKKFEYYLNLQISFCFFLVVYFVVHILSVIIYNVLFVEPNLWSSETSQILYGITDGNTKIFIIVSALILRFIELFFTQKVLVLIHSVFGNLSIEFVTILLGYFLIPFIEWRLYPFGLSSISRILLYEDDTTKYIIAIAFIYAACSVIIDIYISKKRIYNLLER
jgi:hypothetical protein